ncbi:MAG: AraC-like DNA-binding protein [Crocinitomicaceae bacterium]|jgi:AraC-like DNA-binding protein
MVANRNILNLYGKKLFERAQFTSPFKRQNDLSNEACYLHILEGGHNQYSGTALVEARKNEGILMKCGNFIFEPIVDQSQGPTKLVAIHFFPDVLKKLFKDDPPKFLFKEDEEVKTSVMHIDGNAIISHYIQSVSLLFDNPSLADEDILELKLKEIIMILSKLDSKGVNEILNNLFNSSTVDFKEVIEAHLFSALSVEDLASLTHRSLTSFKRKFKEVYQSSPASYIKNKRLDRAAKLLIISDQSISDISFDCAFNDIAHFSNSFKAKFNLTPSEYRLAQNSKS